METIEEIKNIQEELQKTLHYVIKNENIKHNVLDMMDELEQLERELKTIHALSEIISNT